jgi:hypothetical protein
MFLNNSVDLVPTVYLIFLDDMLNVSEDGYDWGQIILSCLYFNVSHSCIEPLDCIVVLLLLASDVVLDMIPDRETEVNHHHSSQLRLFYLIFIFY